MDNSEENRNYIEQQRAKRSESTRDIVKKAYLLAEQMKASGLTKEQLAEQFREFLENPDKPIAK